MTLELELAPELESEVKRQARQIGQSVPEYVTALLREKVATKTAPKPRRELVGYGKYAGRTRTVNDFLADKHEESLRELEKDEERHRLYGRGK